MRKHVNVIGCILVGAALTVAGAPMAHADNDSFVVAANELGFPQWKDNLIRMGQSACYFLSAPAGVWPNLTPRNPEQITDRLMRYGAVSRGQARQFLVLSVNEYCPQHSSRVGIP